MRYRDDILCIFNRNAHRTGQKFLQRLVTLAKPVYTVECESIAEYANFLDIHVFKVLDFHRSGSFQYKPYIKVTQQRVYLNHYSMHPGAVHNAWPLAETSRLYRRSSCWKYFAEARILFAQKLLSVFTHPDVVLQVLSWHPNSTTKHAKPSCIRIVIPYCPRVSGLQRVASNIVDAWRSKGFNFPFDIHVTYCGAENISLRNFLQVN